MPDEQKGLFIDFEGIDGSGGDTQLGILHDKIKKLDKYQAVLTTHEPWRNKQIKKRLAEDEDAYSNAEELADLYIGDRTNHSYILIRPNLDAGTAVLTSRYKMSTCAFQWAQGMPLEKLIRMHENRGILIPDRVYILKVTQETAKERVIKRGMSLEKFEKDAKFVRQTIKNYDRLAELSEKYPKLFGKVVVIDGNPSEEKVAEQIWKDFVPLYREWNGEEVSWNNLLYLRKRKEEIPFSKMIKEILETNFNRE